MNDYQLERGMSTLPPELRTKIYFMATRRWHDAAVRIQTIMRGFWGRFGRTIGFTEAYMGKPDGTPDYSRPVAVRIVDMSLL